MSLKKAISILLLGLLLYNTIGYYLYYEYRQVQSRQQLRSFLDTHSLTIKTLMDESTLSNGNWIVFRIPIELYHQPDRGLESVEGEFYFQNRIYEKAMQRIQSDTLYVYCVNNQTKEKAKHELSDHVKTHIIDYTDTHSSKSQKAIKVSLIQEYLPLTENTLQFHSACYVLEYGFFHDSSYASLSPDSTSPPPKYS